MPLHGENKPACTGRSWSSLDGFDDPVLAAVCGDAEPLAKSRHALMVAGVDRKTECAVPGEGLVCRNDAAKK